MTTRHLVSPALVLTGTGAHVADPITDFYKGKQVKMIIRTAAGGGDGLYARPLMRHMTRHIRAIRARSTSSTACMSTIRTDQPGFAGSRRLPAPS